VGHELACAIDVLNQPAVAPSQGLPSRDDIRIFLERPLNKRRFKDRSISYEFSPE
jgi:hypothetical protein